MGYGPVKNGRQQPITPWQGSWAQQEQERRAGLLTRPPPKQAQWPLGHPIPNIDQRSS